MGWFYYSFGILSWERVLAFMGIFRIIAIKILTIGVVIKMAAVVCLN